MSFWRKTDDSIRWLLVIGLIQALIAAIELYHDGAWSLGWMKTATFAVACLAAVPLDEPPGRDLPWRQKLRTANGLVAAAAFVACLGWVLWRIIHG